MKTFKTTFATLVLATLIFTSCEKDELQIDPVDDTDVTYSPSAADFKNLREDALNDHRETAQFNAEDGIVFTSDNGTELQIFGNCLSLNGDQVTGQVDLEFIDLFDKASMLTTNKPTMGFDGGDKRALQSGGEFFINVTQNGVDLDHNCTLSLKIPGALTGGPENDMTLWEGIEDANEDIAWRENVADGTQENAVFADGPDYYAYFGSFGWTNVDRFYNDPRPKTTLEVIVPDAYDNTNAAIYLSYDGEENLLAKLDTYDANTGIFSEHYGQIPVGLEMHVIFVTEENGQWRYGILGVTVAANDQYEFELVDTQLGTEAQMIAAIEALP